MAPLTGLQAKQLDTALLSAFSIEDLSRLTWFELNVQLEDFASTGSKASVTFKLIKWAEQRGKTAELIRAVIAARPNNPEVAALGGLLPPAPAPVVSVAEPDALAASLTEAASRVHAADPDTAAVNDPANTLALEAIVLKVGRPVLAVEDDDLARDSDPGAVWAPRLNAPGVREGLRRAIPAVGRIEVENNPNSAWVGSGWLVAEDVVVTASFAAREFAERSPGYAFKLGANGREPMTARVDFRREAKTTTPRPFAVRGVLSIDDKSTRPAFMQLEPLGPYGRLSTPPLRLSTTPPRVGQQVAVISHPARDARMSSELLRSLFGDVFEVKRVSLGMVTKVSDEQVHYDCGTSGGSSGGPVIDLATGEVVAMHLGGQFFDKYGLPAAVIADHLSKLDRSPHRVVAVVPPLPPPPPADTPKQLEPTELVAAFMGAFGFDALVKLAANELKVDLNAIAPKGSTEDAIYALVGWAVANNRISELFAAATILRPHNPHLTLLPPPPPAEPLAPAAAPLPPNRLKQLLRKLLLDQFPADSDLAMLLEDTLDVRLTDVAGGKNGAEVRYNLIGWLWVDHPGRLRPFLKEASESRPGCLELTALLSQVAA